VRTSITGYLELRNASSFTGTTEDVLERNYEAHYPRNIFVYISYTHKEKYVMFVCLFSCCLIFIQTPHKQTRNCQKRIRENGKNWSRVPDGCLIPRRTGRLTVGRNIILTLTLYILAPSCISVKSDMETEDVRRYLKPLSEFYKPSKTISYSLLDKHSS
jgi:hypothetical protein